MFRVGDTVHSRITRSDEVGTVVKSTQHFTHVDWDSRGVREELSSSLERVKVTSFGLPQTFTVDDTVRELVRQEVERQLANLNVVVTVDPVK